jgi:hypothetical protein
MAFNPFASFRKYQKYWMAGAVLVCMVTFVLCSGGIRGTGLDDLLMWITRRKGDEYARINNRRYNYEDLQELKNQRNLANDYMRELTKVSHDRLVNIVKQVNAKKMSQKLDDADQQRLAIYGRSLRDLADKYAEPRFFIGGAKLDDLVDFVLWRDLADKYNVNLTDDMVRDLVTQSVHANAWGGLDPNTAGELVYKMRQQHSGASDSTIFKALRDEFRVQIAQLAYMGHWTQGEGFRIGDTVQSEREMFIRTGLHLNSPMQYRIMPAPEQISSQYRKTRTELTIDMLPISLEELAKAEKLPEDPAKRLEVLKQFYDQHAKEPYNPSSDKPGFKMPQRVEAQYITADADMEYYKKPAEILTQLEKLSPALPNVLGPLGGTIGWLSSLPAFQATLEQDVVGGKLMYQKNVNDRFAALQKLQLQMNLQTDKTEQAIAVAEIRKEAKEAYEKLLANPLPQYKYGLSSLLTPYYWNDDKLKEAEVKPSAASLAAFVGALGGTDGFMTALSVKRADGYVDQLKDLEPMLTQDLGKRAKAGSELILAGCPDLLAGSAFTAAALTYHQGQQPQFMPIAGYYERELTQTIEKDRSLKAMQAVMLDCKKRLEEVSGRGEAFRDKLTALKNQYSRTVTDKDGGSRTISGFEFHETGRLRSQYDIDDDPAMVPLQTSFNKNRTFVNMIEGRAGKPQLLRDVDFNKLFFGGETYGLAKDDADFVPKIWPPNVSTPKGRLEDPTHPDQSKEIRLFDKAEKPIIFWTSKKVGENTEPWNPNKLRLVDFTEQQYKMDKARSKLMDEVKRVAKAIRDARRTEKSDPQAVMAKEAENLHTNVIVLKNVAELVENKDTTSMQALHFLEYTLPPRTILFARQDTVKDLLKLHNQSAALQFPDDSDKDLNELNKSLFEPKLGGKLGQVQVISNKPRDKYYVVMVTDVNEPEMFHYFADVLPQASITGSARNTFVDQVQTEYGKQLLKATLEQLRAQGEVNISKQARDQFASSEQGTQ